MQAVVIDLAALGRAAGVPEKEVVAPNGVHVKFQNWSKPYIAPVVSAAKEQLLGTDCAILTGHVDPWVTMAVIMALPLKEVYFRVPAGDTRLTPMRMGEYPPEAFSISESEGKVYLTFDGNALEALVGGPAKVNMEQIAMPAVPEDRDVYLLSDGKFPHQLAVAYTLAGHCRSLYIGCSASPSCDTTVYYCCASPDCEPGDTVKRL